MSLKHRKSVNVADDPAAVGKLRPSDWGSPYTDYDTAPTHEFEGGSAGAILVRDPDSVDGKAWVPSVAGVLVSDGDDEMPEFRPLVAGDIPALPYAPSDLTGLIVDSDIVSLDWSKLTGTGASGEFNVRVYGATGDGVTDDTTAVRAALTALTSAGGGVLVFPAGTYRVNLSSDTTKVFDVTVPCRVRGAGIGASTITATSETPTAGTILFQVQAGVYFSLSGLTMIGPAANGSFSTRAVRHLGGSAVLDVRRVRLTQWTQGIVKDAGDQVVRIADSYISATQQGYLVASSAGEISRHFIARTIFDAIGTTNQHHGIYLTAPYKSASISDCTFGGITGVGIHRSGATGTPTTGPLTITACEFLATIPTGILIDNDAVGYTAVTGCAFQTTNGVLARANAVSVSGCAFTGVGNGVSSDVGTTKALKVSGCSFAFGAGGGTALKAETAGCTGWAFVGNDVVYLNANTAAQMMTLTGIAQLLIAGNVFTLNTNPGIRIRTGSAQVVIVSNIFKGTSDGSGAVYIDSTASASSPATIHSNVFDMSDRSMTFEVAGVVAFENHLITGTIVSSGGVNQVHPGWRFAAGATLASATTMGLRREQTVYHITGTAAIATISLGVGGFFGPVVLIADGAWSLTTTGNIVARAGAKVIGQAVVLVYDGTKWYEVY